MKTELQHKTEYLMCLMGQAEGMTEALRSLEFPIKTLKDHLADIQILIEKTKKEIATLGV